MQLRDDAERYGAISRALHWGIAALLAWQLGGMALKYVLGRVPVMKFWVGTHGSIGTLLLVLILVRIGWTIRQRKCRPVHAQGLIGRAAWVGHLALYALMLAVPALAVLRMIGGSRPIQLFGIPLRGPGGPEIAWMTAPADLLHRWLAWGLLALILGHVGMVLVHRFVWRDKTLGRMLG